MLELPDIQFEHLGVVSSKSREPCYAIFDNENDVLYLCKEKTPVSFTNNHKLFIIVQEIIDYYLPVMSWHPERNWFKITDFVCDRDIYFKLLQHKMKNLGINFSVYQDLQQKSDSFNMYIIPAQKEDKAMMAFYFSEIIINPI